MGWLKHFKKLPAPLLFALGVNVLAGSVLLRAEPPQTLPFVLILIFSIVMAAFLYIFDEGRKMEERARSEAERKAERAEQQLRLYVEKSLGEEGKQRDLWTRPMLQLPLNETVTERVFQVFDAALEEATQSLRGVLAKVEQSNIRANIFLPTSEGAREGDVCNLIIPRHDLAAPEGVQRNMYEVDERNIAFRPNQGATGRVFVEGRAIGVLTNPKWLDEEDPSRRKELDRWVYVRLHVDADFRQPKDALFTASGKFEMTEFHNRRVVEELAWLISLPIFLKIDETLEVVGVFNVDCLEFQITPAQLRAIYYRISAFTGMLSGILRGSPTDRVAIFRFRE